MTIGYKNIREITSSERASRIKVAEKYLSDHRRINFQTGEFKEYYPDINRDKREKLAASRMSKSAACFNLVCYFLEEDRWFYTINLIDVKEEWADFGTIFNPDKMKDIKIWLKAGIEGPFYAAAEVSGYSGAHIHLLCGEQNPYKLGEILKAKTIVHDKEGLLKYFCKPPVNKKDIHTEEYDEMNGAYLIEKMEVKKQNKRCPRRVIYRYAMGDITT